MGSRVTPTSGLVLFDEHFLGVDYLAANTGAATTSDYTEADPQPGRVTRVSGQSLVPVITNAQDDATIDIRVLRSGFAGRAGLGYSVDGTTLRGWNGVKPIGWESVSGLYTTTDDWSVYAVAVIPSTQLIVVVYAEHDTGSVYCRTRAHDTEAWSSAVEVTTNSAKALGLVVTPDEVLVMVRIGSNQRISTMRSADSGTTWTVLARAEDVDVDLGFDPGTAFEAGAAFDAVLVGDTQIMALATPTLGDTRQYASPDLGLTWSLVETATEPEADTAVRCARHPDGTALVAYQASSTTMEVRRFSSAFQRFGSAQLVTAITVTNASLEYALTVDADSTVYLVTYDDDSGEHIAELHTSTDYGTTWSTSTIYDGDSPDAASDADLANLRIVAAGGRLLLLHQSEGGVSPVDGSLSALKLASWTSLEWDGAPDLTWLPIALPDDVNWTATGAGTGSLSLAHLKIETSANTKYYQYNGAGHSLTPCLHTILACTVGVASTSAMGAQVTATTAGATYVMRALLWDDTLRILDNISGATIADVVVTGANDIEVMMWFTGAASGRAAYKLPNDVDWTVIAAVTAHTFSDGGALETNCWVRVGVLSASTVTGWCRFASFYEDFGGTRTGTGQVGKRLSSTPYPLPDALNAAGQMAHLSVRGGLGLVGESYEVDPAPTYAIEHAFVGLHPDPVSREWRSVNDTDEVIVAFDLVGATHIGHALCVHFDRVNFRTAYLEYHDGSAWQTVGTYDGATGFSALLYYRDGGTIYPDPTGTPDSGRMLQEMELARSGGGFAIINDGLGGTDYPRHICSNTAGWWTADTTARPLVNLDGVTGSEPSSGEVTLVAPGGVLVAYLTAFAPRRRWRIRIPAQDTVEGYFKVGTGFSIGRVVPFGVGFGWGAATTRAALFDAVTNTAGVTTRSQRADNMRTWTLDWTGGVPLEVPRQVVDADYLGVSGGVALEPTMTTPWQLAGAFDRTIGQTVPVVAIAALPTSTTTITDRTLYLYGLLTNTLGTSTATGTEGLDEVVRIETLRIDGYPGS